MEEELDHDQIFDLVGGEETFDLIVNNFYARVEKDPLLIPMYPEKLDTAKLKLKLFLIKKFGGPDEYTPLRGHPRMRRRHMKFSIGVKERNRWVKLMMESLDASGINPSHPARFTLNKYFEWMASHMINQSDFNIN